MDPITGPLADSSTAVAPATEQLSLNYDRIEVHLSATIKNAWPIQWMGPDPDGPLPEVEAPLVLIVDDFAQENPTWVSSFLGPLLAYELSHVVQQGGGV